AKTGKGLYAAPGIDHLHGVIAQCGDEQAVIARVHGHVIDAPFDSRQRNRRRKLEQCRHGECRRTHPAPDDEWMASPIIAAIATITGSDTFFAFHSNSTVASARRAVGMSTIERLPSTMTAPVMAPIAAAVTPSTNATIAGSFPYFLKYGAGITVKR